MTELIEILDPVSREQLMSKLGAGVSVLAREELLAVLGQNITAHILLDVAPRLQEEEKNELEKVAETGDMAKFFEYLEERIPDFESVARFAAHEELQAATTE